MYKRVQYQTITKRLKEPRHFLQVVLGPRQVGKTTVIKQVVNDLNLPYQIYSADSIPATQTSWISDCWNTARVQMRVEKLSEFILIIDEIQKIKDSKNHLEIIYVFLTIFLYLLKCPQSLILSALRAFCFCGKPHISRSIFLYFRYQAWLKSW